MDYCAPCICRETREPAGSVDCDIDCGGDCVLVDGECVFEPYDSPTTPSTFGDADADADADTDVDSADTSTDTSADS